MVCRIALTGAPYAGKTLATESLVSLSNLFVLPEAATLLYEAGFPFPADVGLEYSDWVREYRKYFVPARYALQKALEDSWVGKAKHHGISAIICDRSVADGLVYYSRPDSFLRAVGSTTAEIHRRYTAILFFESPVVHGDPPGYNRRMPIEWSRRAHHSLLQFWRGHPRFHYIPNAVEFEAKAAAAVDIVRRYL